MSKLLIEEYPILVLPSLAKKIGLNEAIVIQQVHYWINNPNTGVFIDGFKWVHNTYEEWQENFPFWSVDTVKRTINSLEKSGLLISAKTSKNPFDHTKSYRVNYELIEQNALTDDGKLPRTFTETTISETTNTLLDASQVPVYASTFVEGRHDMVSIEDMSIEWQIAAGSKELKQQDEKIAQMKDSANLISMGTGSFQQRIYDLAYAFMVTRNIIIPTNKAKGNRKAAREMVQMNVQPHHVVDAVNTMLEHKPKPLTCVDLFSVSKIAIDLANPAEEGYNGKIEGV